MFWDYENMSDGMNTCVDAAVSDAKLINLIITQTDCYRELQTNLDDLDFLLSMKS